MKTKQHCIQLNDEAFEELSTLARCNEVSRPLFIRQLIMIEFRKLSNTMEKAKPEKAIELISDSGACAFARQGEDHSSMVIPQYNYSCYYFSREQVFIKPCTKDDWLNCPCNPNRKVEGI